MATRAGDVLPNPGPVAIGFAPVFPPVPASTESLFATGPVGRAADIKCIAQAVAYEAANEPEAGRQAVAQVILNRVQHRAFPKTVCGVVYQGSRRRTGCQFTFTCDGSLRRILSRRTWADSLRIAAEAVDGQAPSTVGSATHYHADYVSPRWAPAMVRVGQIGAHIFYHFPGRGSGLAGAMPLAVENRGGGSGDRRPPVFSAWGLATLPARTTN